MTVKYVVESVEVNVPIEEAIFTIDTSVAERVWDGAARIYIEGGRAH